MPSLRRPAQRQPRPEVQHAVAAARALRAELGIAADRPVDCAVELAESRLGVEVVIVPLPRGVDGLYVPAAPHPVVVVAADQPPSRQRFTLAHEIAHHALGHGAAPRILEAVPAPSPSGSAAAASEAADEAADATHAPAEHYRIRRQREPQERAANAFAGELLAPDAGAQLVVADWAGEPPLDRAVRLSAHYGLSALSASVKLQLIGNVDRRGFEALRAQLATGDHLPRYDALGLCALSDTLERVSSSGRPVRCSVAARSTLRRLRAELDALTP